MANIGTSGGNHHGQKHDKEHKREKATGLEPRQKPR